MTTDDRTRCTPLVQETGNTWALYPHGAEKFGVRLPRAAAEAIAKAILAGAQ